MTSEWIGRFRISARVSGLNPDTMAAERALVIRAEEATSSIEALS